MNVYDEAHNLARAVKESNEYIEYSRVCEEIDKDPNLSQMIREIREISLKVQASQVTGGQPDSELMSRLQSVYAMMASNPQAVRYIEAETRFQLMMKDVLEILGEVMGNMFKM